MQPFTTKYLGWKEYLEWKLTASGTFHFSNHRLEGPTEVEIYTSSVPGVKTSVEIGYASPLRLLFLRFFNPFTPGLNKHQEKSFFGKSAFYPHFDQHGAGLEFDNFNIRGIDEYLSQGFQGSEIVYLQNGKPAKSVLNSNTFPWTQDRLTFYFETPAAEQYYERTVEINLNTVYAGTNTPITGF